MDRYNLYNETGRPALFAPATVELRRIATSIRQQAQRTHPAYRVYCARMRVASVFDDAAVDLQRKLYRLSGHPDYQA